MADTVSVTLDMLHTYMIGNSPFGVLSGIANLTSYSQTKAELTAITGQFKPSGLLRVVFDGLSSNGYVTRWSATDKAIKCYTPGSVTNVISGVTPASGSVVSSATSTTFADTATQPDNLIISGGTFSAFSITRGGYTSPNLSGTTRIVPRDPGDIFSMTFTSGAAPVIESLPHAAPTASIAAALAEVTNGVNVGTIGFIAIGQRG